nr:hypothetical protein [uncultured Treponema sp.]
MGTMAHEFVMCVDHDSGDPYEWGDECNNRPVAKLSSATGKTMCKDNDYLEYLKKTIDWRLNHKWD